MIEMRLFDVCLIDLKNFREALAVLQSQVDQLDQLKASHYQEIIEHEEEVWNVVQNKVGFFPTCKPTYSSS